LSGFGTEVIELVAVLISSLRKRKRAGVGSDTSRKFSTETKLEKSSENSSIPHTLESCFGNSRISVLCPLNQQAEFLLQFKVFRALSKESSLLLPIHQNKITALTISSSFFLSSFFFFSSFAFFSTSFFSAFASPCAISIDCSEVENVDRCATKKLRHVIQVTCPDLCVGRFTFEPLLFNQQASSPLSPVLASTQPESMQEGAFNPSVKRVRAPFVNGSESLF
jgi:hypothetical protein